jgi:hypothetical protein
MNDHYDSPPTATPTGPPPPVSAPGSPTVPPLTYTQRTSRLIEMRSRTNEAEESEDS